ncbi:MAG: hypothetical protein K6T83_18850 [Alicyclobacillus sp.]|nr:hypothetical protein [Alicyclobacillus sp.]
MAKVVGIGIIALIVAIDNALLTGLLLPYVSYRQKQWIVISVGTLLAVSQIVLAASVDQLLGNLLFRFLAIGLLSWMCIRTLGLQPVRSHTEPAIWWLVGKLWIFTVMGNLDNMFWLGSELNGDRVWLLVSSIGAIPVFVIVALFLADQCEKQQWILPLGAGMMAWAAASLTLEIPEIRSYIQNLDDAPRTTFQCLMTIGILLIGLGCRQLLSSTRSGRGGPPTFMA